MIAATSRLGTMILYPSNPRGDGFAVLFLSLSHDSTHASLSATLRAAF